ncbi:MAG: histidine kinase dimerization/phospho-acceptor domain-containing protein, partial [Perlucidibaca sp.]
MHFIKRLPHATSLLITGLSGLLLSTFLAAFVWHKQVDAWHDRFDNGVRVRQQEITNLLSDALVALDRLGRFAEASEQVTREEFDYFTAPLLGNFTSLYMIRPVPVAGGALSGFAPAVVPRDLRAGCQAVDAALRYPVVLYKTADPGTNALGLDLRCDADRVAAMRSAGGSGRVVATRQIRRLMHDGLTMALFRPLYARSAQSDQSGRRALLGYVGAGVAMQMVLKPRLTAMQDNDNYVLSLTDADATGGLRLLSLGSDPAVASAPMAALRLDMAGRNLQLDIRPSAAFWAQRHDQTPALVWLGGVAFTLLLMAWLHSQNTRRVQAEMLAIARNDDVIDREARLTALFQHAPIAILRCDEQGTIADANPAAGRLVASEAGVLAGRQYISLFVPWAAEVFRERWQEPAWLELELAGDGGEPIPALVRTLSMRQPDGTPYAWVMIEDLRLVRHNERLKREFVATVSHELRTPLTAIKGAIELAQSGVMGTYSEEVGHLLDMAAQNTEALTRLINDLLDVERLEQGKLSLHLREQALLPLLERARR